jgi:drug/metabolite transporter (DMT)-like permease
MFLVSALNCLIAARRIGMALDQIGTRKRRSFYVPAGIGLAIFLDTVVQFTWKQATVGVPESAGAMATLATVIREPMCHLTIALAIAQFFNWMLVLAKADLSFAQPITALSYVTVAAVGRFSSLHERIGPMRAVGIALIVIGVWQMSRTEARPPP